MRQIRVLRIVVASASDVQAERDAIPAVIEYLNKSIARDRGLWLEISRWETDAYPTFHPEGPQGAIDEILRIEDCDILIGIFWRRFGTPVKDAQSGTEHEFQLAYDRWRNTGRPQIMFYFNQKPAAPKSKSETDQWGQVLEFRQRFPGEGLWWTYKNRAQFEELLRNHLTRFILHQVPLPSELYSTPPASLPQESTEKIIEHTRDVELSVELGLAQFDERNQKVLRYVVSAFVDVSPSEVEIVSAEEVNVGVRVTLKLPAQSAERLSKACEDQDSDFGRFLHAFAVWGGARERTIESHKNEDRDAALMTASILIVSDEDIISSGLHMLIKSGQGSEVIGVVDNWVEALLASEEKRPDIIIIDQSLRERRALLFIRKLVKRAGGVRVLVITDDFTPESYRAAVRLGVSGIITRRNAAETLLKAIEKIRMGDTWLDELVAEQTDVGGEHTISIDNPALHRLTGGLLSFRARPFTPAVAALLAIVLILSSFLIWRSNMRERRLDYELAALNSDNSSSMPPLTVELEPSRFVRGGGVGNVQRIHVSVSTAYVLFLLHFPQGETHEVYNVSLIDTYGKVLFTVSGLKCTEGKKIPVRVVKELLPRGDYFLTLSHADEAPIYYMVRISQSE
jgi:DNA-binding NarL/FixJ family response regulator